MNWVFYSVLLLAFLGVGFAYGQTPPTTTNDGFSTPLDTPLIIEPEEGILQNDFDLDGEDISVISFRINGVDYSAGQTANLAGGALTINADGSINFVPSAGFSGNLPLVVYTISDGAQSSVGNLNLTVTGPGAPLATQDYDTADIDTSLNVPAPGVLGNDVFEDAETIQVVSFTVGGVTYNAGTTANLGQGSFTLFADGSYVFIPANGYTGNVPNINYTISDGGETSTAILFLTVEDVEELIQLTEITSCNQGFGVDGNYKIQYSFRFRNLSTARDYHNASMIKLIDIVQDIDEIYGTGCVLSVDDVAITTTPVFDFVGNPYPLDFTGVSVNPLFLSGDSGNLFSDTNVLEAILYPRQSVTILYCVTVEPFCGGRPNPTPSGSGVDFETVLDLTSSAGDASTSLLLTDFHTTEAFVTGGIHIPIVNPEVNPDGTYDYNNYVILSNEGSGIANNVNFNLGLGGFLDNGLTFNTLTVSQVSGPPVTLNTNYNGDTITTLLSPNNSLAPGETIVLEIFHLLAPVGTSANNVFFQVNPSQTQGILDDFDEDTTENRRLFSYVLWEDNLGNHLDQYYQSLAADEPAVSDQCLCNSLVMFFSFTSVATSEKVITNINTAPNGILEQEELTFQLSVTNASAIVELTNLQMQDDLTAICGSLPISVSPPEIVASTAQVNPTLNPNFDGVNDINIFDGNSGLLEAGESITIEFTVLLNEDCIGENTFSFTGVDPIGNVAGTQSSVEVAAFTDSDNDGIPNSIDLDDDNDTILDIEESNGIDPTADHDNDLIPNYRDTDFGDDNNNDGIVDSFDFDGDGVPNHLDLDADNDGIFDVVEVGNAAVDTSSNGQTNNPVGENGLDNTVETNDTEDAAVLYEIPDTDGDTHPNYLDIDSDGDGIVDIIEAQPTETFILPANEYSEEGVDTAFLTGLIPIDTDQDEIPDYLDTNSDNDTRDDVIEGWDFNNDGIAETIPSNVDSDNDGLDDAFDNQIGIVNPTNGQVPTDFPNVDYEITFERDWREVMAVVVVINDVSAIEGDQLLFTISLVTYNDENVLVQSLTPVEMTLFTTDGTTTTEVYDVAIAPFDYQAITNAEIVIPAFTETFEVAVSSIDDNISELDELFTLNATITSDNTINQEARGEGTIIDDEALPNITLNNDVVEEGDDLVYTIELSNPSSTPVEISVFTSDFTATSPDDYASFSEVFIINGTTNPADFEVSVGFSIPTFEDNLNEPDEEVLDVLGNVLTNNVGDEDLTKTGTILDIDPHPLLVITDDTVVEGNTLTFTLSLLNANGELMRNYRAINFNLRTEDVTTTVNQDYPFFSSNASIPALESTFTQLIPTFNDELNEETETMNLRVQINSQDISNPTNVIRGVGTIKDNDFPNLFTPNNDGRSDVFRIDGIEDFPNFKLVIFDRWGGEIYRYSNNGNPTPSWWDGTRNGNPVVEGVYFYTFDFNDGVTQPKTGFIQLVR